MTSKKLLYNLDLTDNLITLGNLNSNNITSTNISTSSLSVSGNLAFNAITIPNAVFTNVSSGTISATSSTISNSLFTNISTSSLSVSGNIAFNAITIPNAVFTNVSSGTISAISSTISNSLFTNVSSGTITATSSTISNSLFTNISTSSLLAVGNSNTLGSIITTGGNVGINKINPTSRLDVNGTINANTYTGGNISISGILNSNTISSNVISASTITGGNLYLSNNVFVGGTLTTVNITTTNLVDVTISSGSVFANNITATNIVGTTISAGTVNVTGNVTMASNVIIGGPTFKIPTGNIAARPGAPEAGYVRYNSETQQFEGYGPGNAWGSLGGVIDIAQTTKVLASATPSTTDGNLYFFTVNNERMRINSAGNIGIGTSAPAEQLHITGNLLLRPNSLGAGGSNYIQFADPDAGTGPMQIRYQDSGTAALGIMGGRLGVGTTSPSTTLDVSGTARFTSSVTTGSIRVIDTNSTLTLRASQSNNIVSTLEMLQANGTGSRFTYNGTTDLFLYEGLNSNVTNGSIICIQNTGSKNVGIGTSSPGTTLDVSGTFRATTSVTSGALYATNITGTNIVGTAVSTGTLNATTSVNSAAINATNATVSNIVGTAVSTGTLNVNNLSVTNASISNLALSSINLSSATIGTLLGTTLVSSENIAASLITAGTLNASTLVSSTNIAASIITAGTLLGSTINGTNSTITNIVGTAISSGTFTFSSGGNIGSSTGSTLVYLTGASSGRLSLYAHNDGKSYIQYKNDLNINRHGTPNSTTSIYVQATSGNVGIGTQTPGATLDVSGTLNATTSVTSDGLFATNVTATSIVGTTISAGTLTATNINSTTISTANALISKNSPELIIHNTDYVNNGTSGIKFANTVTPAAAAYIKCFLSGSNAHDLQFIGYNGSNNVTAMSIKGTGNIGIGTTSPSSALNVVGAGNSGLIRCYPSTFASETSIGFFQGQTSGTSWVIGQNSWNVGPNLAIGYNSTFTMTLQTNGNVGIGTSSPGTTLDVSGTFRATTSVTSGALYATNVTATNIVGTTISAGTIVGTTLISSANIAASVVTAGTVNASNLSVTNASISSLALSSINLSSATIGTLSSTTISSANITAFIITAGTLNAATLISSANIMASTVTAGTLNASTGVSSANINANLISAGNAVLSASTGALILGSDTDGITPSIKSAQLYIIGNRTSTLNVSGIGFQRSFFRVSSMGIDNTNNMSFALQNSADSFVFRNGSSDFAQTTSGTKLLTILSTGGISTGSVNASGTISAGTIVGSTLMSSANISASLITTGTLNAATLVSSANIAATAISTGTLTATTVASSVISGTTITGANIYASGDLFVGGTITTVNITSTNLVETNVSAGVVLASTRLSAPGNSNTLGSIITTAGNVGIGTVSPSVTLDIIHTVSQSNRPFLRLGNSAGGSGNQVGIKLSPYTSRAGGDTSQIIAVDDGNASSHLLFYTAATGAVSTSTERMRITNSGNVGINNTSARSTLEISPSSIDYHSTKLMSDYALSLSYPLSSGTGSLGIAFGISNVGVMTPGASIVYERTTSNAVGLLHFCTKSATVNTAANLIRMTISTNGNIGIGTTSPTAKLQLSDSTGSSNAPFIELSGGGGAGNMVGIKLNPWSGRAGGDSAQIIAQDDGGSSSNLLFYTAPTGDATTSVERMRIMNDGSVGIGTSAPSSILDINTSTIALFTPSSGFRHTHYYKNLFTGAIINTVQLETALDTTWGAIFRTTTNHSLNFAVNNNVSNMTINTDGYVGIGTMAPITKLHVVADASGTYMSDSGQIIISGATDSNKRLGIAIDTTNNVGILQAGLSGTTTYPIALNPGGSNVGIGTTSPGFTLDVSGTARFTTSVTSGSLFATNITATNIVGTTISAGNIRTTTTISTGTLVATTRVSSANLSASNITVGTSLSALGSSNTLGSIITVGGGVGIGTSSLDPGAKLQVSDGTLITKMNNVGVEIGGTGTVGYLTTTTNHPLSFSAFGPIAMTINTNGNVGIGTSTPGAILDVSGTARFTTSVTSGALFATNVTATNIVGTTISAGTILGTTLISSANIAASVITAGTLRATTISTATLVATGSMTVGNTLIFNSDPILTVKHNSGTSSVNSGTILLQQSNNTGVQLRYEGNTGADHFSIRGLTAGVTTGNYMVIKNTGTGIVGINTSSPATQLEVIAQNSGIRHTYSGCSVETYNNGNVGFIQTYTNHPLGFATNNGTLQAMLSTNGYFGIGSSITPSSPLHVYSNSNTSPANNGIHCENITNSANNHSIILTRVAGSAAGNPYVSFDVSGVAGWSLGIDNSDSQSFKISNAWDSLTSSTKMTFKGNEIYMNGDIGINTTAPLGSLDVRASSVAYHSTVLMTDYAQTISFGTSTFGSLGIAFGISSTIRDPMTPGASIIHERVGGNSLGLLHFCTKSGTAATAANLIRMTIQTSGNIGIGTTVPASTLDVSGTLNATTSVTSAALYATNVTATNIVGTAISTGTLNATTSVTSEALFATNVTATNIVGTIISAGNIRTTTTISTGTLVAATRVSSANLNSSAVSTGTLTITGPGGVGTNGSVLITGQDSFGHSLYVASVASQKRLVFNNTGSVGNIFAYDYGSLASQNIALQGPGGNVGIGTSSPTSTLRVLGGISTNFNSTIISEGLHLQWNRSNAEGESWIINQKGGGTANSGIRFGRADTSNNVTELMRILDSGNVGIGTNNPGTTLDVSGTFRATTSVTSAALFATNVTATNIVGTTISSGNIRTTTTISTGTLVATTRVSSANLNSSAITTGILYLSSDSGTNIAISPQNGAFATIEAFTTGNTAKLPLALNPYGGNVGIGITNPTAQLELSNSTINSNAPFIKLGNSAGGAGNQVGIKLSPYTGRSGGDSSQIIAVDDGAASSHLTFYTASGDAGTSTERMRITADGNIGIGTQTPNASVKLQVLGKVGIGESVLTDSGRGILDIKASSVAYSSGTLMSEYALTISHQTVTNGSLGIAFGVTGTSSVTPGASIIFERTASTNVGLLHFCTRSGSAGTSPNVIRMTVQTTGNVGIGTTAPTSTLQINGSLAKTSGTFDIKHPIVADKRLVHSFIEGPRCDLIYRGKITLQNGQATVNLDTDCVQEQGSGMTQGTFEALCTNPDYYLQNNSSFDRVRGSISGNILTIVCENSSSTDKISWMVVAERKDESIKEWNRTNSNGFLITEYSS